MNVLLINGSPRANGNTAHALDICAEELTEQGMICEILHIGNKEIRGCMGCNACREGVCVFANEEFQSWCDKLYAADAVIIGSPVYYSAIAGSLKCFLDRAFYCSRGRMRLKIGASIAIPRRSGGMPTFDQLNNYFLISEMVIAPSYYWNVAHGGKPGEVCEDAEGISVLKNMANNMVWLLKMKEATKESVSLPQSVKRQWTNFIR